MKILIISDIEGVSGVDDISMIDEETEGYQRARAYLMDDVNAAVCGAFHGGADEVIVVDGHGSGRNFIEGRLDKRAAQLDAFEFAAKAVSEFDIDAVFSVGAHAMAGTKDAFLDHTQTSARWFEYTVNGKPYGELGQQAIFAGAAGAPLVMMSGDKKACEEARALIPKIACACVKEANERNKAVCYEREAALGEIYKAAKDAVKLVGAIQPYRVECPLRVSVTLYRSDYADEIMRTSPTLERRGRTLIKTVDRVICYSTLTNFYGV